MKTLLKISAIAALTLTAACAPNPSSIEPIPMGNAFSGSSCSDARNQLTSERSQLAILSSQQNGAVVGDALGVLLIGVPVSSLTGANRAGDIAAGKGRIIALETRVRRC